MSLITLSRWPVDSLATAVYSTCSSLKVVVSSNCSMPSTPFMGVRSSWLIMARKSDLARFACSASSRAWISCDIACCCSWLAWASARARLLMWRARWPSSLSSTTGKGALKSPC
ncbi:hypothetical protein D3C80_1854060 [compost metagenome]